MFTKKFAKDAAERVISTFVQAYAAAVVVSGGDFTPTGLKVAAVAGAIAVAKVIVASQFFGTKGDASLVK